MHFIQEDKYGIYQILLAQKYMQQCINFERPCEFQGAQIYLDLDDQFHHLGLVISKNEHDPEAQLLLAVFNMKIDS